MSGHAAAPPPNLKPVLPFLLRAKEMTKADPIISYYCRMWAVMHGLSLKKDQEDEKFLMKLMDQLEKDKKSLKLSMSTDEAREYVENFALKIFDTADNIDREGKADKSTAMRFHASALFMETLKQFGDLPDDVADKIKYAKWKAADISKAIKAGKEPAPVVPDQDKDDREPPPTTPTKVTKNLDDAPASASKYEPPQTGASASDMALAQKYARHAISALEFEDVAAAIKLFSDAIKVLEAASKGKKKW